MHSCKARLASGAQLLDSLSPLRVLDRGYAVVYGENGQVARSVKALAPGDTIQVCLADGKAKAAVQQVQEGESGL